MISEKRLAELQQDLLMLFNSMENDLLLNIAKRINLTDDITQDNVAEWQFNKLMQANALNRENIRTIAKYSGKIETEIERMMTSAGFESVEDDEKVYKQAIKKGLLDEIDTNVRDSAVLANILQASIAQAKDKANLTNIVALQSTRREYLAIVNQTFLEVNTGLRSYQSSVRSAVKKLSDRGITAQTYQTARGIIRYPIDSAVRRQVITTSVQTAGRMQLARAEEYGVNLVEVTSHLGARPEHALWQGKIYAVVGTEGRFRNLAQVTGYGTVGGLQGANCRHQFFPYIQGVSVKSNQPFPLRESRKVFKESQMQRYLEREVRKEKRRLILLNGIDDKQGFQNASVKLKQKEAKLRAFKKQTGRTQANRIEVVGFNRSISQKAVNANRRANE